jgi:hypothetical protein
MAIIIGWSRKMLSALKFVQGAVAKKDFVAALTHFHIANGKVVGYNGSLALCGPIDLDLEVTPKAVPFVRAIQACKETISMHVTENGRLSVKSGKFKAFIDCIAEPYPGIAPEGAEIKLDGSFLKAIKILSPFIAEDASRPWARGILFRGPSAYATNNVVIVEHWLGFNFPVEVNVPKSAVTELLRIDEEPERLQVTDTSITFHFSGGRWLRTQTYDLNWPDIAKVLNRDSNPVDIPPGFFTALEDLTYFVGESGAILFKEDGAMTTSSTEGVGATVAVEPFGAVGIYNIDQLKLLVGVAERADFTQSPAMFFGDHVRGAIVGMRTIA